MRLRIASINDLAIQQADRHYHWPLETASETIILRPERDLGLLTGCNLRLLTGGDSRFFGTATSPSILPHDFSAPSRRK